MMQIWWIYAACCLVVLSCFLYLATMVPSIYALVVLIVVFWIILAWKIRKIVKKRS